MFKKGFSLSELIITVGIIGIIAAATAPTINALFPDKDKVKVLKCHKILSESTKELLEDPLYYWAPPGSSCTGLSCTGKPVTKEANAYSGNTKYQALFMDKVQVQSATQSNKPFTTVDGIEWSFVKDNATGNYTVSIDLNTSTEGSNCYFSGEENCKSPDIFMFTVSNNGIVTGKDALTQAYLLNSDKFNEKRKDYAKAYTLLGN